MKSFNQSQLKAKLMDSPLSKKLPTILSTCKSSTVKSVSKFEGGVDYRFSEEFRYFEAIVLEEISKIEAEGSIVQELVDILHRCLQ
jgi:hypothetical protein